MRKAKQGLRRSRPTRHPQVPDRGSQLDSSPPTALPEFSLINWIEVLAADSPMIRVWTGFEVGHEVHQYICSAFDEPGDRDRVYCFSFWFCRSKGSDFDLL